MTHHLKTEDGGRSWRLESGAGGGELERAPHQPAPVALRAVGMVHADDALDRVKLVRPEGEVSLADALDGALGDAGGRSD